MTARRSALTLVAIGMVASLAACSSDAPTGVSGDDIKPIAASSLPGEILGLKVHQEDVKNTIARADDTYVTAVSLFSLRSVNVVNATLQVSRLSEQFNVRSRAARESLADKIGGSRSAAYRLGSDTVYITQGLRQRVAVWFRAGSLYVLSVRDDFARPRSLLRAVLELQV
jgi:hypothetical protein